MTKLAVRENLTTRGLASLRLMACMVIPKIIMHACMHILLETKETSGCIKNVELRNSEQPQFIVFPCASCSNLNALTP